VLHRDVARALLQLACRWLSCTESADDLLVKVEDLLMRESLPVWVAFEHLLQDHMKKDV
jgi:hypothetical protein